MKRIMGGALVALSLAACGTSTAVAPSTSAPLVALRSVATLRHAVPTAIAAPTAPVVTPRHLTPRVVVVRHIVKRHIAPVAAPAVVVTECTWAVATLAYDAQLDNAEVAAVVSGGDTRYGTPTTMVGNETLVQYYQAYANEWTAVGAEVALSCTGQSLTPAQSADALGWFATASAAHAIDARVVSANAYWDNIWISNYARLSALVAATPSPASA